MKTVKTTPRNRIGDQFMNDYIVCFVEKDFLATILVDEVIAPFQKMEDRKGKAIFCCPVRRRNINIDPS
uniref:Uncharacterized protein n=1 Tax=Oryza sativa subsp. japonica TaxID=39947 RepID=Q64M75_ORYSJ|nr:hypothetical protein [Oryza sativa Japonica Group]